MSLYEIIFALLGLHIIMAMIMAVFPRDNGMRNKIGASAYTPNPQTAGDYIFNVLALLIAGGAIWMECINERIARKPWLLRVAIRLLVLSGAIMGVFFLMVLVSIFQ